jgi:glycosyltransferase involved in cell wall biosynthesis
MDITVILCTFNRCQLLRTALESVAHSILSDGVTWDVLVVDNNSKDDTRQVVTELSSRYPGRFRYLFETRPGKSYALNAGIAEAKGEYLAFMDDDVTVDSSWLRNLIAPLHEGKWAGVGGRVFPQWTCAPPRWLAKEGWVVSGPLVYFDRGDQGRDLGEAPVGTNMAFHKRVFEQVGGFRTDLGPSPHNEIRNEDSEFARRLMGTGQSIYYEPSAVVYHYVAPERLRKKYMQDWWFDKGRSDTRETGVPVDMHWRIAGVPSHLFVRLARWTAQWMVTVPPQKRFECKLKIWLNAGIITECRALSKIPPVEKRIEGHQTAAGGPLNKSGIEAKPPVN